MAFLPFGKLEIYFWNYLFSKLTIDIDRGEKISVNPSVDGEAITKWARQSPDLVDVRQLGGGKRGCK